jgi:hypothetical protein
MDEICSLEWLFVETIAINGTLKSFTSIKCKAIPVTGHGGP